MFEKIVFHTKSQSKLSYNLFYNLTNKRAIPLIIEDLLITFCSTFTQHSQQLQESAKYK